MSISTSYVLFFSCWCWVGVYIRVASLTFCVHGLRSLDQLLCEFIFVRLYLCACIIVSKSIVDNGLIATSTENYIPRFNN